jgi:hypothetical protein
MSRQLDIFKGRRHRGAQLPTPKEYELHCMVADVLRRWCHADWRFCHIASGEYRTPATAARLHRMGVVRGWPDLILVGPSRVVFLELKRKGGRLSDEQEDLAAFLVRAGCSHYVVDSFDAALRVLREAGIVRAKVSI